MANQYIPSFLEHQSDRKARERAEARTAQASHDIGYRYRQQMKHGNFLRRAGDEETGQSVIKNATRAANDAIDHHHQREAAIARAQKRRRQAGRRRQHDRWIKQIEKNRGSAADVARREHTYQKQRWQQQQARTAQEEALRWENLGAAGQRKEKLGHILDKIEYGGGDAMDEGQEAAADQDTLKRLSFFSTPAQRLAQSRTGIPRKVVTGASREGAAQVPWDGKRSGPFNFPSKNPPPPPPPNFYDQMIKSATQPRARPTRHPAPAAAPVASAGEDIEDVAVVMGQGDDGYASLDEDDDDEEEGEGGTPIQPARTLSPKRGIVVHARPKGRNTPTTRTSRRREAAAAAARARRRTRSGIGSGGIVVHSSNPSPAARDALRAKVEGNLGQLGTPTKKKAWYNIRGGGRRRRTHKRKRTHRRRRKRRRTRRMKNRKKKRRRRNTRK